MKNEIVLSFCIWNFTDVSHDDITKQLGIQPSKIYVQGQRKNPNFSAVAKQNGWIIDSGQDKHSSFDAQMNALLDLIESRIDVLKPLCEKYTCEFSCAVFIYFDNEENTPWVHLGDRYNKIIKDLNIEFDLDLYCLPNKEY